jgi:antitoxin (DNA-binding transcriptional repressor) of toxin-antitoxin stability system
MEDVTIAHAKEHLEELLARATRGEEVHIVDPKVGTVKLTPADGTRAVSSTRRMPGRWKDRIPEPPPGLFDPMTEEELKDWYGDGR